jgi:hypothetical protein
MSELERESMRTGTSFVSGDSRIVRQTAKPD